jgi:hypothetical protein
MGGGGQTEGTEITGIQPAKVVIVSAEIALRSCPEARHTDRWFGKAMDHQFYISLDNEKDFLRCKNSMRTQLPITIVGLTLDGQQFRSFDGVIQSIDDDTQRGQGKRYRVVIRD